MFRSENSQTFVIGFVAGMMLFGGCDTKDYSKLELELKVHNLETENQRLKEELGRPAALKEDSKPADESTPAKTADLKPMNDPGKLEASVAKQTQPVAISLAEEKSLVAELENMDVYFDFDEQGFAFEADFKECREVNPLLEKVVSFSKLRRVLLDGNRVDAGSFSILGKIRGLEYLDLERSSPSAQDFENLKSLPKLSFLQLFKATLDEEACQVLAEFPALEQIRCAQTRVGDAELAHISKIRSLKAIDLSDCNRVTPVGLKLLAEGCPKLVFLKVWGKSIGNDAMNIVAQMESLRVLGLVDTAVNDEGVKKLRDLNLTEIHLFRTSVGDEGIKVFATMPNMSTLNLRDTKVSDEAMAAIAGLKKLRKLDLSECTSPGITDASADAIAKLGSLQQLNLWSTKITDEGVAKLSKMKNLKWLNLDACAVTDKTSEILSTMKQLTWIHLGKTKITDASVPSLKRLDGLEYLNISNTDVSQDAYYDLLDSLSSDIELIGP